MDEPFDAPAGQKGRHASLETKLRLLRKNIRSMDSALVSFSGGVDSSVLLRICREELGEKAVAVTFLSEDYPSSDMSMAKRVVRVIGAKHITVRPDGGERRHPKLSRFIKRKSRMLRLKRLAAGLKLKNVLNGSHADDAGESSATLRAAMASGVRTPLLECGLSKAEIRLLAKEWGLPNWDSKSSGERGASTKGGRGAAVPRGPACAVLSAAGVPGTAVRVRGASVSISVSAEKSSAVSGKMGKLLRALRPLGVRELVVRLRCR